MIEIENQLKRGYVYGKEGMLMLDTIVGLEYKLEKKEIINKVEISTIEVIQYKETEDTSDLLEISNIKCKHGIAFDYKTTHRLPQEGWEELIDCWSCHNSEFKSMLDLKTSPRVNGILVSNFYLIAHPLAIPKCCSSENKKFYNQIDCSLSTNFFIYTFFKEYFAMKSTIVLKIENTKYEIKLFYECDLITKTRTRAFKVGYRESNKQNDNDLFIGEFFKTQILEQLVKNDIGLELLCYKLSFITLE